MKNLLFIPLIGLIYFAIAQDRDIIAGRLSLLSYWIAFFIQMLSMIILFQWIFY